jgi:hypothetical protein
MPINYESVRPYGAASSLTLPTAGAEGSSQLLRTDLYGGLIPSPLPSQHQMSLEGTYFEFHNATLDLATTIAGHAAPVVADIDATFTKALFFIRNTASAASKKRLHLLWLQIGVATAGATGSDSWYSDHIGTTTRYSSGGTALTVVSPNMECSTSMTDNATVLGGAVVVSAENSSTRVLGFDILRPSIEGAGDNTLFRYGLDAMQAPTVAAASVRNHTVVRPPVILASGAEYFLGLAATAQNAAGVYKISGGFCWR